MQMFLMFFGFPWSVCNFSTVCAAILLFGCTYYATINCGEQ